MTDKIICGAVDGEEKSFYAEDIEEMPALTLNGHDEAAFYTLILSNPDDMIPIAPIIHQIVGNVKGSDLATGDISKGTEIKAYKRPNPPVLWF